jgi:hypothetical protein
MSKRVEKLRRRSNTYADIPSVVELRRDEGQEAVESTCMAFQPFLRCVSDMKVGKDGIDCMYL